MERWSMANHFSRQLRIKRERELVAGHKIPRIVAHRWEKCTALLKTGHAV
jgi:hypothetical protein